MINGPDVRVAGDSALLMQLPAAIDPTVNARAIAIAEAVRRRRLAGVRNVVSTFRSVAVYFDPLCTDPRVLEAALSAAADDAPVPAAGRTHEIPVAYGADLGPDLSDVARFAGIAESDVIARHTAPEYRVYMLGFQPGFAYLGLVDPAIAMPRRSTPRLKVAAGSVGIAGRQTGIYPGESPGGWQIIGRALELPLDLGAASPARFAPGDTVRFRQASSGADLARSARASLTRLAPQPDAGRLVTVVRPGLFTTIQCGAQWGRQGLGFPASGAMDPVSHAIANLVVGNDRDAAALEVTIVGPELRLEQETMIAIAGAHLSATIDGRAVPMQTPVRCAEGTTLRFGERIAGARVYVAFNGGIRRESRWPVKPVAVGEQLTLGAERSHTGRTMPSAENLPAGGARLRVMRGPQDDLVPEAQLEQLLSHAFTVSPQSNRMGYRLKPGAAIAAGAGEMISDATFTGAIQLPPSGEPILLMADRQTTGGYPQIATVITADIARAGQLAPGDRVEFDLCSGAEALVALRDQERILADAG
jgi:KipI family sensor histidine kinase inhibitor